MNPTTGNASLGDITDALAAATPRPDSDGGVSREHVDLLHRHGLLALTVAHAHGGAGAGLLRAREVIDAVARGDPSTARVLASHFVQTRLLSEPGCRWQSPVRARVLHDVVRRGALLDPLRVEPGAIGPSDLPATTARRTASGWHLSGHKIDDTCIEGLRWFLVWARTDEAVPRVGPFLVSHDWPGVRPERNRNGMGDPASTTRDVCFDDVAVPQEHAVDLRHPELWRLVPDPTQELWTSTLIGSVHNATLSCDKVLASRGDGVSSDRKGPAPPRAVGGGTVASMPLSATLHPARCER